MIELGERPLTWVFTGDSITQGAQHTRGWRSFSQHFEERVRYELRRMTDTVINTAISGNETIDLLPTFAQRVTRYQPDVVILMLATNDAVRGRGGEATFRTNTARLVADIQALGAVAILATPNPVQANSSLAPANLARYVEIMREIASATNVTIADHYGEWIAQGDGGPPAGWMSDAIHPNQRGHLAMAKTLFRALGIFDPRSATCNLNIS